ncbi:MAG: radical SAM/Cys-rich domain protein [Deltaproteobacteria bacterium]|nr:radical SAM/Cys-rich domain protein [Deltaproteobacteria bacterium]
MNEFELRASGDQFQGLFATGIDVIQVNVGLMCNQSCLHCHLECSPRRAEVMDWPVMERVLDVAGQAKPRLMDITGGAPELNPHIRRFIFALRNGGHKVQVRTNLTAFLEPGLEGLAEAFREMDVQLVASMPCYLEENVCAQRGPGVYGKSVKAIRMLNSMGYGVDPDAQLNLVYNPGGAFLPGDQTALENAYRRELGEKFGIRFSRLLTITNMPIGRFLDNLRAKRKDAEYMELLRRSFNPWTLGGLMCRYQISVCWDGSLYDCDFNLALGYSMNHGAPDHIDKFDLTAVSGRRIVTGVHCYGCTAGGGSSCGGALVGAKVGPGFKVQRPTFKVQRSTFKVQCPTG